MAEEFSLDVILKKYLKKLRLHLFSTFTYLFSFSFLTRYSIRI